MISSHSDKFLPYGVVFSVCRKRILIIKEVSLQGNYARGVKSHAAIFSVRRSLFTQVLEDEAIKVASSNKFYSSNRL